MNVATYEGIVDESGQERLLDQVNLPINARVFIVVPQFIEPLNDKPRHIYSPRLVNPAEAADFRLQEVAPTDYASL